MTRVQGSNDPYQRDLLDLPLGRFEVNVSGDWAGMSARPGVELAFTDGNGRNWLRSANGRLISIAKPAAQYYGLEEPLGWMAPSKTSY